MAFSVSAGGSGSERVLQVSGELDIASAGELRSAGEAALNDSACTALRLDLAEVSFMDSTGLGVLIGLRNSAEAGRKDLVIANPSPTVSRLLDLSGLLGVFRVEPTAAV